VSEKVDEKIKELEERLANTIPNKHTQKSINCIKASLARLRDDLIKFSSSKKGGRGFGVKKTGDAQIAFIGFPNVGKSSLLNLLTEGHTHSKVASYDFTTVTAIPGMMNIEQAKIQLIDLPGIILGAAEGKGRGKEVLAVARSAELILIILCFQPDRTINFTDLTTIRKELFNAGIRVNESPARISIKMRESGGIHFSFKGHQIMDKEEVKTLINDLGFRNAGVYFAEPDVTPDQLIDYVLGNRIYSKDYIVINKSDLMKTPVNDEEITRSIGHDRWILISAKNQENINALRLKIFQELNLIRIYLKPPKKEADMREPIIMRKGDSIRTLCGRLHKDFIEQFRYAMIWGETAKHPGQKFTILDQTLTDGDIVSIYLKR